MKWKHLQVTQEEFSGYNISCKMLTAILWESSVVLLVDAQIHSHTDKLVKYLQRNISRSSKRGDGVIHLHDNVRKHTAQGLRTCCKILFGKRGQFPHSTDFGPQGCAGALVKTYFHLQWRYTCYYHATWTYGVTLRAKFITLSDKRPIYHEYCFKNSVSLIFSFCVVSFLYQNFAFGI
jgi:hypothetical protein